MKKTLKIVLPILLVLALLATGYWFFFRARVDLTTGMLRRFADSQLESGHYSMAIRCYRWANSLDPQDSDVAVRLAEAYRKSGNYTKTESTLVHAIYDAPEDAELYRQLCRVYVEQDKLLDAQQLLDGISNELVRQELDAQRPAAPVFSPESGFYSEYISVELTAEAPCYVSRDGSYPSLETDAYGGAIQLPGGDSRLCAVAVGENGLVSPAVYANYTVAGVVEDVEFHDQVLLNATQELLHREGRTLRTDDLWAIREFTLPEGLTDSTDLRWYTGMTKLTGSSLGELDYSFLAAMPELQSLDLEGCVLSTEDLRQIASCKKLEVLVLANCGLSDLEPLREMESLRVLDLSENSVSAMGPVAALPRLEELYLGHNAVTTVPSLLGLSALRILDLSFNAIEYAGGVSACTGLERLNLEHNRLSSAVSISALKELVWLNLSYNAIVDAGALAPCTKLESFLMTDNKLTDVDFLSQCPNIREVNIDYNDVKAVPAFQTDCSLERFSAAHNFLEDLSGLGGLQKLGYVNADYNNIRDISVLSTCPALATVNVYGTMVHSGGELAENGVIVNFTPGF